MSPIVSCFYIYYTSNPIQFIFIRYENYMKIILNSKSIIISNNRLIENKILFQIYILSLLCTKDTSKLDKNYNERFKKYIYSMLVKKYWKCVYYTYEYEYIEILLKDPFISKEPKRESSSKKLKKFMKIFNSYISILRIDPINCIIDFYEMESIEFAEYFRRYINYNRKIYLLTNILHNYGRDIYMTIRSYL